MAEEKDTAVVQLEKKLEDASGEQERASVLAELAWAVKYPDPHKAVKLADEAIEISSRLNLETNLPRSYMAKAIGLMHMSRFKLAESSAKTGLEIYTRLSNRAGIRHARNVLGSIFFRWGRYANALENFIEALRIHGELSDAPDPGILSNLGAVYLQLGDTEKALEYYTQVHEISGESNGPADLKTAAMINMGEIYGRMNMYEAAIEYLSAAEKIAEKYDMKQALAVIADNMGTVLSKQDRKEDAMESYRNSMEIFKELEDLKGQGLVLSNMGRCMMDDDPENALDLFSRSNDIFRSLNDSQGASETLVGIARCLVRNGETDSALENLAEALEIAGNKHLKPQLSEIHHELSTIFENIGDHEKAFMHLQLFHEIEEDLRSERVANRLRNLRVVYQVEEARREAAMYRVRNIELEQEVMKLEKASGLHFESGSLDYLDEDDENSNAVDGDKPLELDSELIIQRVASVAGELEFALNSVSSELEELLSGIDVPQESQTRIGSILKLLKQTIPMARHLATMQMEMSDLEKTLMAEHDSVSPEVSADSHSVDRPVLIVEDDPDMTQILIEAFRANGYRTMVASNLETAREIVSREIGGIGCIFVDVLLPDGSGIDLLKQIRNMDRGVPLIAGSGYPISKKDMEYLDENRIVFLEKPYNIERLMLNLSTMLPI